MLPRRNTPQGVCAGVIAGKLFISKMSALLKGGRVIGCAFIESVLIIRGVIVSNSFFVAGSVALAICSSGWPPPGVVITLPRRNTPQGVCAGAFAGKCFAIIARPPEKGGGAYGAFSSGAVPWSGVFIYTFFYVAGSGALAICSSGWLPPVRWKRSGGWCG